jgi:hypothetical protein
MAGKPGKWLSMPSTGATNKSRNSGNLPTPCNTPSIGKMSALGSIWWPWGAGMAGWFVTSVAFGIFRTRKRSQEAASVAQELGFTFTPWIGPEAAPQFATALFQKDLGGSFKNVMAGSYAGLGAQVFDYSCTTGSAQNSTSTVQTVAVYTQTIDLPAFALSPKTLADQIIDAIQHQNVELDCPPGVSLHYVVHGSDKEKIRSLFDGRRIRSIESLDRSKGWHIEGAGKTLVLYRYARRVKPTEVRDFLQETSTIAQAFLATSGAAAAR